MRFFTLLSGAFLTGAGTFCFAEYANAFSGVAFILGICMLASGACDVLAYLISGRKDRLPDTLLVEGILNLALSFAILNNQVIDATITVFFAIWILFSGINRLAHSLAVSRINPKFWFAVVPLSLIDLVLGLVMLMPSLISDISNLVLVAVAFITNGFSIIVYAMYMVKMNKSQKETEAQQRAEAKIQAEKEERAKKNALRKMSREEREAARREERRKEELLAEEMEIKRQQEREARRSARRPLDERTMEFSEEEVAEIISADKSLNKPANTDDTQDNNYNPYDEEISESPKEKKAPTSFDELWEMTEAEAAEESKKREEELIQQQREKERLEMPEATKASWKKPTDIPSLRANLGDVSKKDEVKNIDLEEKRGVVNLERIETDNPEVIFEKVELKEVEKMSEGGESEHREEILNELSNHGSEDIPELSKFKPLTLEDLFADEEFNITPLSKMEATQTDLKLTQTFTFDWLSRKDVFK